MENDESSHLGAIEENLNNSSYEKNEIIGIFVSVLFLDYIYYSKLLQYFFFSLGKWPYLFRNKMIILLFFIIMLKFISDNNINMIITSRTDLS